MSTGVLKLSELIAPMVKPTINYESVLNVSSAWNRKVTWKEGRAAGVQLQLENCSCCLFFPHFRVYFCVSRCAGLDTQGFGYASWMGLR